MMRGGHKKSRRFFNQRLTQAKQCPAMVPKAGLEPARCHQRGILNPLRLPFRHLGLRRFLALRGDKVQRQNHARVQKCATGISVELTPGWCHAT